MKFIQGDKVRYIGSDKQLQLDYGKRELTILGVEAKTGCVVCATVEGHLLVGVNPSEIELMDKCAPSVEKEAS
jgi:hypothetical protein